MKEKQVQSEQLAVSSGQNFIKKSSLNMKV